MMKILKLTLLCFLMSTVTYAQDDIYKSSVPQRVLANFHENYSKANLIEWEQERKYYGVEFVIDNHEFTVWYDSKGNFVKEEKDIRTAELPKSIRTSLNSKFKGFSIAEVIRKKYKGKTTYNIELEKGISKEFIAIYNRKGKYVRKHKE